MIRHVVLSMAAGAVLSPAVRAAVTAQPPLDPKAFASIGTLNVQSGNVLTIDTGDGTSAPTLYSTFSPPGGGSINVFLAQGKVSNGVAVFDFDSLTLPAGSTLNATGALPLALLSRGTASLNGRINASASGSTAGPGGYGGGVETQPYPNYYNDASGDGPGGGVYGGGGGSYGGTGGSGTNGAGPTYGSPLAAFAGGSGGGSAFDYGRLTAGGGGGGALEISALGDVTLGGSGIALDGAAGTYTAGGGSGGGLLVATPGQVTVSGPVTARGGASGGVTFESPGPGGGGGGRILFETAYLLTADASLVSVVGGTGEAGNPATSGTNGTIAVTGYVPPSVPEPAALAATLAPALLAGRRRRPVRA